MELFQTVSNPSQATSLWNMPGHYLWAWAGRQARGEGTTSLGSLERAESSRLSEMLLVPSCALSHRASNTSSTHSFLSNL